MTRGGKRTGAGRPTKPIEEQAKRYTFRLYKEEVPIVRAIIKQMHEQRKKESR